MNTPPDPSTDPEFLIRHVKWLYEQAIHVAVELGIGTVWGPEDGPIGQHMAGEPKSIAILWGDIHRAIAKLNEETTCQAESTN